VQARARDAADVEAGQRIYTPLVLHVYDLFVLGCSNRFAWRCPSVTMLERFDHLARLALGPTDEVEDQNDQEDDD
jgi:hypothetical protein